MGKENSKNWTKEELLSEIKKLKKRKKYGVVWENKPENVAQLCNDKLPILIEEKNKKIKKNNENYINFLVEGDNYHALSVLNYTHKASIDVIYIDPPFNTGSTAWRYNNYYVDQEDAFKHSKWISFMYKRIKLVKKLLKQSGIFICAIDDYECHDLRGLLDEIFGEDNRLGTVTVLHNPGGRQDDKFFATAHEYMLIYSKNKKFAKVGHLEITEKKLKEYKYSDEFGRYKLREFRRSGSNSRRKDRPKLWYPIYIEPKTLDISVDSKNGYQKILPFDPKGLERVWRWGPHSLMERKKKYIYVKKDLLGYALYVKEREGDHEGEKPKTYWDKPKYSAVNGTNELKKIFSDQLGIEKIFDYPKSPYLIYDILKITSDKKSVILDFFAGSGTTAQAVLQLNKDDGGERRFIIGTNNEVGPKLLKEMEKKGKSEVEIEKQGICRRVCYPRIKRVMEGYPFKGNSSNVIFEKKITVNSLKLIAEMLDEIDNIKRANKNNYDSFRIEFKENVLRLYGILKHNEFVKGLGGNLKYYKTDFVDAEPTDINKKKLVDKSTEMLCLKEDCFDFVKKGKDFQVFKGKNGKLLGIVYDDDGIELFKKVVKKINDKFIVYVFSLDESAREEELDDISDLVTLKPIPAVILNVYKRIFR